MWTPCGRQWQWQKGSNLVTIGITPTYPETGYGYINFERDTDTGMAGVYRVERFVESRMRKLQSSIWLLTGTSGTAACSSGKHRPFWQIWNP